MPDYFNTEQTDANEQMLKTPFENELNSTFTKLEKIQDEIVTKKIAELEAQLQEMEHAMLQFIENAKNN